MALSANAQEDDFGTWISVEAQKSCNKRFSWSTEIELRTRDASKAIDRMSLDYQGNYKLWPWMKVTGGFAFLYDHNKRISHYQEGDKDVVKGYVEVGDAKNRREFWGVRLRGFLSATVSRQYGKLKLSLRERWQYTYHFRRTALGRYNYYYKKSDSMGHVFGAKGKNELRSRLSAEYKISKKAPTPYMSIEAYNCWELEKMRYTIGTEWRISKGNTLDMFYLYQHEYDHDYDTPHRHIVGIGYKHDF